MADATTESTNNSSDPIDGFGGFPVVSDDNPLHLGPPGNNGNANDDDDNSDVTNDDANSGFIGNNGNNNFLPPSLDVDGGASGGGDASEANTLAVWKTSPQALMMT
jgi:hypothetical protein